MLLWKKNWDGKIELTCPKCGCQFTKPLAEMESQEHCTCPGCHLVIGIDELNIVDTVDQSLRKFKRDLGKVFRGKSFRFR